MSLRFALFGHPVAHSMSPAIHAAAYRELGLDHRFELVDLPDAAAFARGVEAVRSGAVAGANVTIPWKREALRAADVPDPVAARVGAANVLARTADGGLRAANTDAPALAEELARVAVRCERALILGSGGAALGAIAALGLASARRVAVSARRFRGDRPRSEWEQAAEFERLGVELLAWPGSGDAAADAVFAEYCEGTDVLLQATSAGMHGADSGEAVAGIVPWTVLPGHAAAYDLVYNPAETPFLRAARARGLAADHGLGMLVVQAALAIELWLGRRPPREPLYAAAEAELRARGAW